jgi:hypothetical protein
MKTFLKMVIGLVAAAGITISAEAQYQTAPVIWTYGTNTFTLNGVTIGGGLFTNAVLSSGVNAGAADYNTVGTSSPSQTNFLVVGGITNLGVQLNCNCYTNVGTAANYSNCVFQLQGSKDYTFWNSLGMASNATWVADPLLTLTVTQTATNAFTDLNVVGVPTNGLSGQTNLNVSGYTAIRPYSFGTTSSNVAMTNLAVILWWKQ